MRKKPGQVVKKKSQRKTIYDVYEPSELERGHFTDFDEKVGLVHMHYKNSSWLNYYYE